MVSFIAFILFSIERDAALVVVHAKLYRHKHAMHYARNSRVSLDLRWKLNLVNPFLRRKRTAGI